MTRPATGTGREFRVGICSSYGVRANSGEPEHEARLYTSVVYRRNHLFFKQLHGFATRVRNLGVAIAQFLRERRKRQQTVGISRRSKPKSRSSTCQYTKANATLGKRLSSDQSNIYTFPVVQGGSADHVFTVSHSFCSIGGAGKRIDKIPSACGVCRSSR